MPKQDIGEFKQRIKFAADQIDKIRQKALAADTIETLMGSEGRISFKSNDFIQDSSAEEIKEQEAIIIRSANAIVQVGMPYEELMKNFQMLLDGLAAREAWHLKQKADYRTNYGAFRKVYTIALEVLEAHKGELVS